jgi:hypothetical protein
MIHRSLLIITEVRASTTILERPAVDHRLTSGSWTHFHKTNNNSGLRLKIEGILRTEEIDTTYVLARV